MPTPLEMEGQIEVIQGSLGSGKSAVSMCEAVEHLLFGGVVATNFNFTPDWAWLLSGRGLFARLGLSDRFEVAEGLRKRCFKIGCIDSIMEISGREGKKMRELCQGRMSKKREAYGLLVIDEAHMFFNARAYNKNKEYIDFFSQARKNGWRVILVAHSIEMLDKQIRFFVELESRFRNLRKVKAPFLPFSLSPVPAFLIVRKYAGKGPGAGQKHSIDLRFLHKDTASMYSSFEIFAFDDVARRSSLQGLPVDQIPAAREYYKKRHGVYPGKTRPVYKGNIRGPYSVYCPKPI
ncbi:MAG: zonular occludens toxin domain-containing protein [Desulfocapsaceae bacterium]|nr:zonular occludens toxin domain-containing protein [Desulfocapsaceae bacterium]